MPSPSERQGYIDQARIAISDAERLINGPTHPTDEHLGEVWRSLHAAQNEITKALGEGFIPQPYKDTAPQTREERAAAQVAAGERLILDALDIILEPDPQPKDEILVEPEIPRQELITPAPAQKRAPSAIHPWRTTSQPRPVQSKTPHSQNIQLVNPAATEKPEDYGKRISRPPTTQLESANVDVLKDEEKRIGPATPEQLFRLAHLIMTAPTELRHKMGIAATPENVRIMTAIYQQAKAINPEVQKQLGVNTGPVLRRIRTFLSNPDDYLDATISDLEKELMELLRPLVGKPITQREFLAHARI